MISLFVGVYLKMIANSNTRYICYGEKDDCDSLY